MSKTTDKNDYQRQYRKNKKHCTIIFTYGQHDFLNEKAKAAGKPFGTYVRELALANAKKEYVLPLDAQDRAVVIQFVKYGTLLNQIAFVVNATKQVTPEVIEQVRANFSKLQHEVRQIYNAPIEVKELVRQTAKRNPDYVPEMLAVLIPLKP